MKYPKGSGSGANLAHLNAGADKARDSSAYPDTGPVAGRQEPPTADTDVQGHSGSGPRIGDKSEAAAVEIGGRDGAPMRSPYVRPMVTNACSALLFVVLAVAVWDAATGGAIANGLVVAWFAGRHYEWRRA